MADEAFRLEEATIAGIHQAFRRRSLTCRQLVHSYLDRIEAYDRKGPALNSIVTVNQNVLAEADRLDELFSSAGTLSGPLHGIPVVVKDQAETRGIVTTFGSIALDGYVPQQDATAIARLKQAGAIILAKSAMPDFATSWFGFSSKSGETKNPYALDRDPGGSSSGTGAAVAANLAAVGIGEDTGGSIRVPASFNNLVGLRVTPGLISRTGMSPLVISQDTAGPMTRTVTDAALVLDALAGYDPKDPYTSAYVIAGHTGGYTRHLDRDGLKGARIGVLTQAFGSEANQDSVQVNALVTAAIKQMEAAGAEFVEIGLAGLTERIIETSLYLLHSRHDIDQFLGARPELPYRTIGAIHATGKYHPILDLFEQIVQGPANPADDPGYFRKLAAREELQRDIVNLLARSNLVAACFPCVQVLPPMRNEVKSGKWPTLDFPANTLIASQAWMPSICVPAGFTETGIPVGLEIITYPYHEPDLFRLAYSFEQITHHRRAPESTRA
jgi:amidase